VDKKWGFTISTNKMKRQRVKEYINVKEDLVNLASVQRLRKPLEFLFRRRYLQTLALKLPTDTFGLSEPETRHQHSDKVLSKLKCQLKTHFIPKLPPVCKLGLRPQPVVSRAEALVILVDLLDDLDTHFRSNQESLYDQEKVIEQFEDPNEREPERKKSIRLDKVAFDAAIVSVDIPKFCSVPFLEPGIRLKPNNWTSSYIH
jgi:hypothetical protein